MSAITAERCAERPSVKADEVAAYVVAAAIWAPSVHNTQPWWFATRGAELTLHADSRRQLGVVDPAGREMLISGRSATSLKRAYCPTRTPRSSSLVCGGGIARCRPRTNWRCTKT